GAVVPPVCDFARETQRVLLGVHISSRERRAIHPRPDYDVHVRGPRGGIAQLPLGGELAARRTPGFARAPGPERMIQRQRRRRPTPPETTPRKSMSVRT